MYLLTIQKSPFKNYFCSFSGGNEAETYRNRKSYFSLNTQVVCDTKLKIRDIVVRWPGSVHDMTIFNHSRLRARFEGGEFPNSVLLGKFFPVFVIYVSADILTYKKLIYTNFKKLIDLFFYS